MPERMVIQGRKVRGSDIALIRDLIAAHPKLGRSPLSADICLRWNWRNAQGRTRNGRAHRIQAPVKDVYLYPLIPDFRGRLGVTNRGRSVE